MAFVILVPVVLAALMPGIIAPYNPQAAVGPALAPPGADYLFGTDDLGRDLFSMLVHGARSAAILAVVSVILTLLVGGILGVAAGLAGGLVDAVITRFAEFVAIMPRLLVLLLLATLFGPSLELAAVTIGLMSWPGLARIVRAESRAQKYAEHVLAAHALGATDWRIGRRHILPAAIGPALSVIGPIATAAILTEAGLSYLGLSDPDLISWGDLIRNGQSFFHQGWWLSLFPGLAIVLSCLGLTLLGLYETEISAGTER
ncbi:ABC transporter permease [Ovoidimarina sediminis]|uniref:ABC transporter permease n=1 Tax=Ovoidimarina sediminis TaxID=3079856 RepID=UPI002910F776|nr:ABC transporter permease [Rhodophyticola sp. MJ-SS7]MDU8944310.1 ABC transporter permease [Rhodophyticola sp. MJ-SS7]